MRARVRLRDTLRVTIGEAARHPLRLATQIAQDLEATRRSGDDSFGAMGD